MAPLDSPVPARADSLVWRRERWRSVLFLLGLNPFVSWASEPVNINLASVEVLAEGLQGAGLAKAHRIVEYPENHGPFEHFDKLAAVQRIGSATLENNRSVTRLQYC